MNSFLDNWCFTSKLYSTSDYNIAYVQDGKFMSGRDKYEAIIKKKDEKDNIFAKHNAMKLISKKTGKPYYVISREKTDEMLKASIDFIDNQFAQ